MTVKCTFHFLSARYTPSETHYLNTTSQPTQAVAEAIQYAGLRVPTLGNFASLIGITISTVPASRVIEQVDSAAWPSAPTWPADPSNDVFAADRPYSSVLVRMTGQRSIRNWWLSLAPDALIQTPGQGNAPGINMAAAPGWSAHYISLMTFLTNPINGWGFLTRTADVPVTITGVLTNAGFPGLIAITTANQLALTSPPATPGVGSRVNITGFRRVNPTQLGLSGVYKIAGIIAPVAPAASPWTYILAATQGVTVANVGGIGQVAPLSLGFTPYVGFDTIRATGKKRGGRYALSSWEILTPLGSHFSPCGRKWTWLSACYKFPMRIFIGGRETIVPARWFFADPAAPWWRGPHGCEASPWLRYFETNDAWGEVTPEGFHRTWDNGKNPGYRGLCYVGEEEWFENGRLPAGLDLLPAIPYPQCCKFPPVEGPIILAGEVTALALPAPSPAAGSSGGSMGVSGPASAVGLAVGPIQLGGVMIAGFGGVAGGPIQLAGEVTALAVAPGAASGSSAGSAAPVVALVGGPIVLGGVVTAMQAAPASASGSSAGSAGSGPTSGPTSGPMSHPSQPSSGSSGGGGGMEPCSVCPGGVAAVQYTFSVPPLTPALCADCAGLTGVVVLGYATPCEYTVPARLCGGATLWRLAISTGSVTLGIGADIQYSASAVGWDCVSPLTLALVFGLVSCLGLPPTITLYPV